jgi:K+-sensing histidine kinase KdpD
VLFDPFVARSDSPQEYGISLMACYFITRHHGGKIEAHGAEPRGTIFRLTLPVNPNELKPGDGNPELLQQILADDTRREKWAAAE